MRENRRSPSSMRSKDFFEWNLSGFFICVYISKGYNLSDILSTYTCQTASDLATTSSSISHAFVVTEENGLGCPLSHKIAQPKHESHTHRQNCYNDTSHQEEVNWKSATLLLGKPTVSLGQHHKLATRVTRKSTPRLDAITFASQQNFFIVRFLWSLRGIYESAHAIHVDDDHCYQWPC